MTGDDSLAGDPPRSRFDLRLRSLLNSLDDDDDDDDLGTHTETTLDDDNDDDDEDLGTPQQTTHSHT